MNILMVSSYLPEASWGAGARSFHLLKALAQSHAVTVLAPTQWNEDAVAAELRPFSAVHTFTPPQSVSKRWLQVASVARGRSYTLSAHAEMGILAEAENELATGNYHLVLFEGIYVAGSKVPPGVRIVIDQHNIEHELLARAAERERSLSRRWYNQRESRLLKPVELERCRRADLVLVTSEREREILSAVLPEASIVVIPNGVDTNKFAPLPEKREVPNRIIFTGTMSYFPNEQAVLFFAERCWPRVRERIPDVTWQIVGGQPTAAVRKLGDLPGVEVVGAVPDMRPHLATAQVALAPLLVGSGTRLKILEALSMERAVVTTRQGCEGLAVRSGEHLIVEDDPEAMAHAVVTLLEHPEQRRALGAAGRALAQSMYSWDHAGDRLLGAVGQLVGEAVR